MFKLFAVFLVTLCVLAKVFGDVVHLNDANFNEIVDGSSNVLVEFYAPWCGHCKNLAPEWKIAGETFQEGDGVVIADVDATVSASLASKFGVQGYPTIKYFPKGSVTPQDYQGGRTADAIVKWVNEKVGTSRKVKMAPSFVTTLTTENFDKHVGGSKAALVEFYAPWCGHCKSLAPTYEKLGQIFAGESDVVVAKVDATEDGELADKFQVQGYPTLKFFPAGSSEPVDYNDARDLDALVRFLNKETGSQRRSDGRLLLSAGRLTALDALLSAAQYKIDSALVAKLSETVAASFSAVKAVEKKAANLYLSVAKKVLEQGTAYLEKEMNRLEKMAASPNVKAEAKTGFEIKQNVLRAFHAEWAQEAEKQAAAAAPESETADDVYGGDEL